MPDFFRTGQVHHKPIRVLWTEKDFKTPLILDPGTFEAPDCWNELGITKSQIMLSNAEEPVDWLPKQSIDKDDIRKTIHFQVASAFMDPVPVHSIRMALAYELLGTIAVQTFLARLIELKQSAYKYGESSTTFMKWVIEE